MPREIGEAVFLVPMPKEFNKEVAQKCAKAVFESIKGKGNIMSLDKDSFKKLVETLTSVVSRVESEAEAEHATKVITQLRDFAEHRRREFVQLRLNQRNIDEANKNSQLALDELFVSLNKNDDE